MDIFIITFISFIALLIIASTSTLYPEFKSYKEVYKTLPNRQFFTSIVDGEMNLLSHKFGELNDNFFYFSDGSFCLRNGVYLHNGYITYLSPYSLYWLIKYTIWFKRNIDVNTLDSY
jgi:hypothetical protein